MGESTGAHLRKFGNTVEQQKQNKPPKTKHENSTQEKEGRTASFCLHHPIP